MKHQPIEQEFFSTLPSYGNDKKVIVHYTIKLYPAPHRTRSSAGDTIVLHLDRREVLVPATDWATIDDEVQAHFRSFMDALDND